MADFFTQKSQFSEFQQPGVQLIMELILANSNALINYQPSICLFRLNNILNIG